ncbi:Protein of unknown function [Nitrosomonas marina]|uniref:Lysozyme inhibitor LprI-like N-terminal domain-containing protein n=1 Tax=Nitrosomonas marina TaxID=917 RepID=A0A1H9YAB4_9PROT|nr:lysozyme inhibitor LprI family protein [Nitrosomonas marina]SES65769.1 Protein of unknown function [Nitrosomonas marina]
MPTISMSTGNRIHGRLNGYLVYCICGLVLLGGFGCLSGAALALDNPDAPDYIAEFNSRAQTYERDIQQIAQTTQDYLTAYAAYEQFLDKELNQAYSQLMDQLSEEMQNALRASQRKWLGYRDAAFEFIALNWTTEHVGSASVISRGDYRTTIIRDRVMLLLHYLQNY